MNIKGVNGKVLFAGVVALLENPLTRDKGLEIVGKVADIVLENGPFYDAVDDKTYYTREEIVNHLVELMKLDPTLEQMN